MDLPIVERARQHENRRAICANAQEFNYQDLLEMSARVAHVLLDGRADLNEERVAFLVTPGFQYAAIQWGVWRAGGIAVPLCVSHPPPELRYVLEDADVQTVMTDTTFDCVMRPLAEELGVRFLSVSESSNTQSTSLPSVSPKRRAMIVYTSGTTSRPKGVVSTHNNIRAQIDALLKAWQWQPDDHILHVLPLHHVHGIINVLSCALGSGACCEMLPKFDAETVWQRFVDSPLTLFMAVPTVYARLIRAWENTAPETQRQWSAACKKMRLMVSGSAALPVSTLHRWKEISGHVLLERYGMTEIGMALSNPLHGERRPGSVGTPLPTVDVRLVDDVGQPVTDDSSGEIEVRGPSVFHEYWRRDEATRNAFRDGWFRTGDVAVIEDGRYRILGRQSVDIIKTGGYKVSALEIEEVLRTHASITECAVVGVEDPEWGERIAVAVVFHPKTELSLETLRAWAKERLAAYKVPTLLSAVESLPRNTMGKVTKPDVAKLFA